MKYHKFTVTSNGTKDFTAFKTKTFGAALRALFRKYDGTTMTFEVFGASDKLCLGE